MKGILHPHSEEEVPNDSHNFKKVKTEVNPNPAEQ